MAEELSKKSMQELQDLLSCNTQQCIGENCACYDSQDQKCLAKKKLWKIYQALNIKFNEKDEENG